MRSRRTSRGVTVNAIAGTSVVTLGLDLSEKRRTDCLGFAIQREDKTEDERYWMRGQKTFAETDPGLGPGGTVSSREHPFQSFMWADYSAKPDHEYVYSAIPLYGEPTGLKRGPRVDVSVQTESEYGKRHSAFFNRGSVATQEYARQFENKAPDKLEGEQRVAAYRWLSRGLLEALQAFIGRAEGEQYGIYGAIYEFEWHEVLEALRDAARRGASVDVLYDGIPKGAAREQNELAIGAARMKSICRPRTTGNMMHNKFFILTRKGRPVAVWTGSTNLTENGIFGHLNCGHIVEDSAVAGQYMAYWKELSGNPTSATEKDWMAANNPRPPEVWEEDTTTVFSPHRGPGVLDWYKEIAAGAKDALFMTFAFGMDKRFKEVYSLDDDVLRIALMDKVASGARKRVEEEGKKIQAIRNRRNVLVSIGNRIVTNSFDRWLEELGRIISGPRVPWVHTKFMLVDPLSESPVTITGSANFSEGSTSTNNENMLVIRGDTRVADIYLGEFMRTHSHYAFRESVAWHLARHDTEWKPQNLESGPGWQKDYFDQSKDRYWRRRYFAQSA